MKYELVIFEDTTHNKTFHLLREQIDTSFVDLNQIAIPEDDVIGSFRNSWGLYIINPNASREQVLIQVPHPCDDFIAPYIAMDLFLEIDAFGFTIMELAVKLNGPKMEPIRIVNHILIHHGMNIPFFKNFKKP